MKVCLAIATLLLISGVGFACSSSGSMEEGNSPAGDYSYCGALTATCNAFYAGTPTECSRAARDQCSSFQPTYSQAFQDSVVSCAKAFSPCIANFDDCIRDTTANARPTAAQAKVRDDFCAVCPDKPETGTVGPCSTFFTKDADAGIGIYGVGVPVLTVNDSIAAEIGTKCIGISFSVDGGIVSPDPDAGADKACDPVLFTVCANTVVRARTAPSACQPDAG
jgi:hypothetical protein